jgi:hypothetical protein
VLQEPRVQLKDGLDCTKKEPTSVGAVYYRFIPLQVGKAGAELKGTMSEAELHILKARMLEGRRAKHATEQR